MAVELIKISLFLSSESNPYPLVCNYAAILVVLIL